MGSPASGSPTRRARLMLPAVSVAARCAASRQSCSSHSTWAMNHGPSIARTWRRLPVSSISSCHPRTRLDACADRPMPPRGTHPAPGGPAPSAAPPGSATSRPVLHGPAQPHRVPALQLAAAPLAGFADHHPLAVLERELVLRVGPQVEHLVDGRIDDVHARPTRGRRIDEMDPLGSHDEGRRGPGLERCPLCRGMSDPPARLAAGHPRAISAVDLVAAAQDVRLADEVGREQRRRAVVQVLAVPSCSMRPAFISRSGRT